MEHSALDMLVLTELDRRLEIMIAYLAPVGLIHCLIIDTDLRRLVMSLEPRGVRSSG
ncbi:hypothetical protein [Methylobacterium sp. Leaf125]|uniref:hypothetical protein n=1 Tax=Methylobacterium sp. Leaf125 TaxID=1736265 RepID=UPI001910CC30|nr:hypothetical protein [Methylobacterium sp. Leaf125]